MENLKTKAIKRETKRLKVAEHNFSYLKATKDFQEERLNNQTKAEIEFGKVLEKLNLKLEPQYKIEILGKKNGKIKHIYYADFCDVKNKAIFEIDGDYHLESQQVTKDLRRTMHLSREGYKVFRISNSEVLSGNALKHVLSAYLFIGIDLRRKKKCKQAFE